jgi:ferrous iron transport protein B
MPTAKVLAKHIWHKGQQYLQKMGGVILVASIIIWALENFPRPHNIEQQHIQQITQIQKHYDSLAVVFPEKASFFEKQKDSALAKANFEFTSTIQSQSYIARLGKFFQPLMEPLGFDWKMTVSLMAGISAKEIVVSTLSVLYQADDNKMLREKLKNARYEIGKRKGQKVFTSAVALAFIIFILTYFPCIATVTAVAKESGSWKWALFLVTYTTTLAWLLAFITYHAISIFSA